MFHKHENEVPMMGAKSAMQESWPVFIKIIQLGKCGIRVIFVYLK